MTKFPYEDNDGYKITIEAPTKEIADEIAKEIKARFIDNKSILNQHLGYDFPEPHMKC